MNDWLRERGGEVLLTAGLGNASINYGGLPALPLYLRRFGLLDWLREVIALHSNENVRWRGLLFNSFEPAIPEGIAARLRTAAAGVPSKEMVSFVRAEWRALAPAPDPWPRDYFAGRLAQIGGFDAGSRNRGMAALTGIEERDPTGDRELIDFSLNLPPDALVGRGRIKPLVRDALADRVPMPILSNRLRGYSGADWYSRIDQADCRKALEDIAASRTASDLLDIAAIARAIDRWPAYDPAKAPALTAFGNRLAKALSTGLFLAETDRYPLGT